MAKELYINLDKDDVKFRLVHTICRYKSEPVWVRSNDKHILRCQYLKDGNIAQIDYRDQDFDYRSPPLGYMFVRGEARYISRIPSRDNQKQGLYENNICCLDDPNFPVYEHLISQNMRDCILGIYLPVEEALRLLENGEARSVPVSRHIAIDLVTRLTPGLRYKTRLVGNRSPHGHWVLFNSLEASIIAPQIKKAGIQL